MYLSIVSFQNRYSDNERKKYDDEKRETQPSAFWTTENDVQVATRKPSGQAVVAFRVLISAARCVTDVNEERYYGSEDPLREDPALGAAFKDPLLGFDSGTKDTRIVFEGQEIVGKNTLWRSTAIIAYTKRGYNINGTSDEELNRIPEFCVRDRDTPSAFPTSWGPLKSAMPICAFISNEPSSSAPSTSNEPSSSAPATSNNNRLLSKIMFWRD